jgi:sigma-B regulation protein RsbU (phosphoserine phosphatase)
MCASSKFKKLKPSHAEPAQAPPLELKGAQLAAASYGQRTGNDLHDYIRVGPDRVLFALLDVAGRSDQSRAVLSAAQDALRSRGTQLLANDDVNEADAMIEVCVQMNRAIIKAAGRVCACPVFAGCYNETLGTLCYVNAGHTPGLLRDESGISELRATGLPLGLFSHSAADASIAVLRPDATLLIVSRGTVDAIGKGKEFGLQTAKDFLLSTPGQNAQEICARLVGRVKEFMANKPPKNHATMIALARLAADKPLAASRT